MVIFPGTYLQAWPFSDQQGSLAFIWCSSNYSDYHGIYIGNNQRETLILYNMEKVYSDAQINLLERQAL